MPTADQLTRLADLAAGFAGSGAAVHLASDLVALVREAVPDAKVEQRVAGAMVDASDLCRAAESLGKVRVATNEDAEVSQLKSELAEPRRTTAKAVPTRRTS